MSRITQRSTPLYSSAASDVYKRQNIGDKYVCKDGPVFRFDQLDELPNEY